MGLCINIDADTRLQFHYEMVIVDSDLFEPALYQQLIKLGQTGGLLTDEILQLIDTANLPVTGGSAHDALLFSASEAVKFHWQPRRGLPCLLLPGVF